MQTLYATVISRLQPKVYEKGEFLYKIRACFTSVLVLALALSFSLPAFAQPPAGFVAEPIGGEWNVAVGLTFSNDGERMYVWEKGGKVWIVEDGERKPNPLIDLTDEVGDWGDHGLLGFALDPSFEQNGYIYLLYVVDRNYLMNPGSFNPNQPSMNEATIGRVTRYQVDLANGGLAVKPNSRKILLGETPATGIPILYVSHGVGSLVFGEDGSLLVSAGDGATANGLDSGYDVNNPNDTYVPQGLADGIIDEKQDVGAFRSQQIQSYNGKILRIDPATGRGLPNNPYYDAANPNAAASKVWSLGLRNPFRFTVRPGTGNANFPGIIYVGDVGLMDWEEINIVDKPGMNFGWPLYEGLEQQQFYYGRGAETLNKYAPNEQYTAGGTNPLCKPFYSFQDLLKQPRKTTAPAFLNPCDNATAIPAKYTFVHARPALDWVNDIVQNGVEPAAITRTGTWNGEEAAVVGIGQPGSPVTGQPFYGSSSTGGIWYTGTDLPAEYRNTYFFGDYGAGWIRNATFDGNNNPKAVRSFIDKDATVTAFGTNPVSGGLYYINYATSVFKITFYGDNTPPKAVAEADKLYGASPLRVQFTGSKSTDAEDQSQLTYSWNFGDGSAVSNQVNPVHTFTSSEKGKKYEVVLTVTDPDGLSSTSKITITLNNTPPVVNITSPAEGTKYPFVGLPKYNLRATVTDGEDSDAQLVYEWQLVLHHNTHVHPEPVDNRHETEVTIQPIGCDGETYFYRIHLKVTDTGGLSTTDYVDLYPDCSEGVVAAVSMDVVTDQPYAVGTPIALKVKFADKNRAWEKVEYFNGSTLLGTATTAPYTFNWQNARSGTYSITAKATDTDGHSVTSEAIRLVVGTGQVAELQGCLPGLVHYIGMDKVNEGVISDFASLSTATCTDCPEETTGKFDGALSFNGQTNAVNLNDATAFNWGKDDSFTISFWMRTDATHADNAVIIGRNSTESSLHWWLGVTPQGFVNFNLLDINHQGVAIGGKGPKVNDGNWHHVIAMREDAAGRNRLYVDGVLVEEKAYDYANGFTGQAPINVGYLNLNNGYHYAGNLDELKLHSQTFNDAMIAQAYNAGEGMYCGSGPLGITDNQTFAGTYEVYPNPTPSNQLNVFVSELQPAETVQLQLFDITGKMVLQQKAVANPDGTLRITVHPKSVLPVGLYNLLLTSEKRTLNRKVIVR
ncbi:PQQ-dependent sugar dehydrogenase [Pontibacter akesuensis]|nr:PQQ-dependent sugar dehydrogenase [Pontibacter akesuensis]GHA80322.1 hypothetical protein GCM10007389_38140 [Pontibacter akesuensis]